MSQPGSHLRLPEVPVKMPADTSVSTIGLAWLSHSLEFTFTCFELVGRGGERSQVKSRSRLYHLQGKPIESNLNISAFWGREME